MNLPGAFARISFTEPVRARANLALLKGRLPDRVLSLLPSMLAQVPDPDAALNHLERFTREAGRRVLDALVRQPALLHYLLALFSHSRFLSETLIQQPDLIVWLARDKHLERLGSKEELLEEYARFETIALDLEPARVLARFKRRQYLRIALKDILGLCTLVETTRELSTLADVLLEKALAAAGAELRSRYGPPQTSDARGRRVPARFAVVSLGKLGGNELNYSSDIDLLFLYAGEGETSAAEPDRHIANSEFFVRLAQRLLQLIAGVTREGAVFRVDLRLRPGGREGDLAISLPAAIDYYQRRAREWELQALLKARHSAGDPALVRSFLSTVEPFLFRGPLHFAAVESVVQAREGFARKLDAEQGGRLNVKLAPGGIRDIEFLVQCVQRLHGQDDPWVRAPGTLVGLQKLYDKRYLPAHDHFRLAAAYQFLRLVEHRLQLEQGQQIHSLPENPAALALLARRCGLSDTQRRSAADEFRLLLEEHLRQVRAIYERILPHARRVSEEEEFSLQAPEAISLPGELSYAEILNRLRAQGSPLYAALRSLAVPERTRKAFQRFLASALASSAAFEQVSQTAAALPRVVEILRLSEPMGALLVRQPERLAELSDIGGEPAEAGGAPLGFLLTTRRPSRRSAMLRALVEHQGPLTEQMAGLRRYFSDAVFRWGARELCVHAPVEDGLRAYTALAEDVLQAGLAIAEQHGGGANGTAEACEYAVIALGRLGTAEMDLGSDADLIFVAAHPSAQSRARPVAEKFLHVISGYTREGTLFPVDVRLRPRGSEGELVQTTESVLDYFHSSAGVWEAATYLKARPVAGHMEWGEQWCERLRAVLRQRFSTWETIRAGLREMRQRLEEEGASPAGDADNFKTGRGGSYDLDFILSACALRAGAASQAGWPWREQVEALLGGAGASTWLRTKVSATEGEQLRAAARLLRAVDHAIRLASGQSAPRLPAGPRSEVVAELTGTWLGERMSPASLAQQLAETRRALHAIFLRVFD
ncbi:MAG: hypothetical protein ACE5HL_00285 [Terriglobia bacterium]